MATWLIGVTVGGSILAGAALIWVLFWARAVQSVLRDRDRHGWQDPRTLVQTL